MANTQLRYRTFDELLYEVGTDFYMYNNEGLIEPAQLIKVAQKVNYDLGLRICMSKDKILDIEKNKVKLPDDFFVLNYALICGQEQYRYPANQGRHTENVIVDPTATVVLMVVLKNETFVVRPTLGDVNANATLFVI